MLLGASVLERSNNLRSMPESSHKTALAGYPLVTQLLFIRDSTAVCHYSIVDDPSNRLSYAGLPFDFHTQWPLRLIMSLKVIDHWRITHESKWA
jgi:hypothetical protein